MIKSKIGLAKKEILNKYDTKELTRVNSKPTYTYLQVWNGDIWGNISAIMSIGGQGNKLIGDYISATLYTTICLKPYPKPTNPGNNLACPTGATQAAYESIKDSWYGKRF